MRLIFWVTALAVLSITCAKNSTAKTKPKRQLESIRTPTNLQYSLVLPHSRVTHFRSLTSERRISNVGRAGKLPPYAVQMEPVVQYSQKDPLYDPSLDNLDDAVVNKNELYAQPKILHVQDQASEHSYGPPYGSLPTAPLYSHEPHPQYYEAPEPIIEIIIKESNETLPSPPPQPIQKKKKEPVHVFYVKYSKDPHNKDKVVYEKPIPAITPPTNQEEDHHEEYVTVTPEPYHAPLQTTTLRAIIKPESEVYHSDSSVKITFGKEGNHHYSDRREGNTHGEEREETAPRPAIAFPQQPYNHPQLERSALPKTQHQELPPRSPTPLSPSAPQNYRPFSQQHAQNRIQFQQPHLANEQQLPRQGPSVAPFRGQGHVSRQTFGSQPSQSQHSFSNGPIAPNHFNSASGPTVPGPIGSAAGPGPIFPTAPPRPNNSPSFHPRPSNPPQFAPRPHFNGPPRTSSFHSGPQRPFHQPQPFFDEAKYLQENYHTITTEQVDPPKEQLLPVRQHSSFSHLRPSPSPAPNQFHDHNQRQQLIPLNQQLPQQRPHQQFSENLQSKPSFVSPSRTPFFNLKPSPPQIEDNRPPFQPLHNQPPQQPFSFHQGPQPLRPSVQIPSQQGVHTNSFPGPISVSPSPIPQTQFLPQPSSATLFNYQAQPSPSPEQFRFQQSLPSPSPHFQFSSGPSERPQFLQPLSPSERPQFLQPISPSERPQFHSPSGPSERPSSSFQDQSNFQHQQNVAPFVPNGGELVAAIPKYEQHITVNGPTAQPVYSGFTEPTPTASHPDHQQIQQQQQQQQQIHQQQQIQQQQQLQQQQQIHQQQQINQQQQIHPQIPHQQLYDAEQEQVRLQLAANVQKQQEEIQRLQSQLLFAQQQHHQQQQQQLHQQQQVKHLEQTIKEQSRNNYQQIQVTSPRSQYSHDRSQSPQQSYVSSTSSPYYQTTSRTVEIKPTTPKYVSSTANSITTPDAKKEEKKKKPTVELPDEVPDDLRQQLLSSGILDNADISILDYDKVGDTPLDSLPPDQLANFFSAGGAQQIAGSENRPIVVTPNGDRVQSRIDDEEDDQEIAASENVPSYVAPPPTKQAVEMKVVHFDPKTEEGKNIAKNYVKKDATQVDPVALNDKKYNRYLPLKVSGNQFPLPDILKGRKVTSVVVLAPVETEALNGDHNRAERAATDNLKGIKFIAGDSLQNVLKKPTQDNFQKWLEVEKKTATDLQSVVLLVTGNDAPEEREIYMYDIATGNVNKLSGELSNAFVEAAENNSLSKDIEKLAIEGEGTPENFDDRTAEASENVPLLVDLSGLSLDQDNNQVSISSGYSKTKLGRSLRRH